MYGILMFAAFTACITIAYHRTKSRNLDENSFWDLCTVVMITGIIGARLYHIINYWEYYYANPIKIIMIWQGGLGIWGGILGAVLGTLIFVRLRHISTPSNWLDLFAGVLPLGQAIGRWGNYFNQENFGLPTFLPWSIYIDKTHRPLNYVRFERFHPLFLYESILDLLLFWLLSKKYKQLHEKPGAVVCLYIIGYGIIRTITETFKINPWETYGINVAAATSAVCAICAGIYLRIIFKRKLV